MKGYYKQVVAVLKQHGFSFVTQKGAHQKWRSDSAQVIVSTNCASRHTANAIMQQAGLDHRF